MASPAPGADSSFEPHLATLIELLPEPCAALDDRGQLCAVNEAWRDVFFNTGLGLGLLEACAALFQWDGPAWAGVTAELQSLLAGELGRVSFEAQIADPPERWAVCSIAASPQSRGFTWQLADVTRWQLAEAETRRIFEQYRDAVDSISDGFAMYDAGDRLVFNNRRYRELFPLSADAMKPGRGYAEIVRAGALRGQHPEATGRVEAFVAECVALHRALATTENCLSTGRWVRTVARRTGDGGTVCISADITEQREAEALRRQSDRQDEMLRAQEALLAELSTPILRISEGAMVLPLIGALDSNRARRVVEELLMAVDAQRAGLVILDITGVPVVDTQVANVLIECARAVRLLGARMVLTGIRPDVAQTVVALGIDLGDIVTRADLREGIAYALKSR
jgi:rsbT co-antagonist protein RsbR